MKRLTWEQDTEPYAVTRDNKIQKVARVRRGYLRSTAVNFRMHITLTYFWNIYSFQIEFFGIIYQKKTKQCPCIICSQPLCLELYIIFY